MPLAYAIAFALASAAQDIGWVPPTSGILARGDMSLAHLRAITGWQPKATRLPPLVSEFEAVLARHNPSGLLPYPHGHALPTAFLDIQQVRSSFAQPKPKRLKGGFLDEPPVVTMPSR